jgi:hypothetical protein
MPKPTTASPIRTSIRLPSACPECQGEREYRYHADPTGTAPPMRSRNDTGWHDGWWHKRCWACGGSGSAR